MATVFFHKSVVQSFYFQNLIVQNLYTLSNFFERPIKGVIQKWRFDPLSKYDKLHFYKLCNNIILNLDITLKIDFVLKNAII